MTKKNTIWTLLKKYKWNSIFLKYTIMLFMGIILPLSIITFLIFYTTSEINRNHYVKSQCEIYEEKISENFSDIINTVYSTQNSFFNTPALKSYLSSDYIAGNELAVDASQVMSFMQNTCQSSEYIDSIYLYNDNTKYVITNTENTFLDNFSDKKIISDYIDSEQESVIIHRNEISDEGTKNFITFYNKTGIYGHPNSAIIYNIDCTKLANVLYSSSEFIKKIYIVDSNNIIIYSNDNSLISENFETDKINNTIICEPVSSFNIAFTYSDNDNYAKNYLLILLSYTIVTIFTLSLSLYLLSKRFFHSIVEIINIIGTDDSKQEPFENEFQFLLRNIKSIASKNSNFETEFAAQYKKLKHSQAITLQSQINPHFIFNVLNTISLIDMKQNGEPTDITKIIDALSDILRSLMNSDKYIITLERELSYVDKYLTLQNIKYNNKFNFIDEIEPETLELPVIKFMLQPIIENCITHGILKLPEIKGNIILKSYIHENYLIIEVSNTGNLMESDEINKINKKLFENDYPSDKHIGLLNVNNRIKLIFGEDYGCNLSHHDRITTVTITLPKDADL